jgi:hypothetical protein
MRLFMQILSGEVRKWFKALPATNIQYFTTFETSFITRWGDKKNPLQLLTQYNNMKRVSDEMVQELSACFMRVYNSIPTEVQPPPGAVQLRYTDSFDSDFSLLLKVRTSTNLDAMMSDTIKVEVNLMVSGKIKHNFNRGGRKPQGDAQPSTSRPLEDRFKLMMNTMEKMMERMSLGNKLVAREQHDPQPRNQNPRRDRVLQIR